MSCDRHSLCPLVPSCTARHRCSIWQLDQVGPEDSHCPARQTVGSCCGSTVPKLVEHKEDRYRHEICWCSLSSGWELRNLQPINRVSRLEKQGLEKKIWQVGYQEVSSILEFGHRSSVISWERFGCLSLWNCLLGECAGQPCGWQQEDLNTNFPQGHSWDSWDSFCIWMCWLR